MWSKAVAVLVRWGDKPLDFDGFLVPETIRNWGQLVVAKNATLYKSPHKSPYKSPYKIRRKDDGNYC